MPRAESSFAFCPTPWPRDRSWTYANECYPWVEVAAVGTTKMAAYGGYNSGALLTCEHYAPDVWSAGTSLSGVVDYCAGSGLGSVCIKSYGYDVGDSKVAKSYDFSSWTNLTDGPAPARHEIAGTQFASKHYAITGYISNGTKYADVDTYDGASWASITDISSVQRATEASGGNSSKMYVTAGYNTSFGLTDLHTSWSGSAWGVETVKTAPASIGCASACISEDYYCTGGSAAVACLKWSGSSWSTMNDIPGSKQTHGAVNINAKVYAHAGAAGVTGIKTCYEFDATNWATKTSSSIGLFGGGWGSV